MLIQEVLTDLPPAEVLSRAKEFFTTRLSQYTALVSEEGPAHVKFDLDAGEIVIGTVPQDGRTLVRGSTSRAHHELSQFLTTLAPAEEVRQNLVGPGASGAG
jgi:hypothetical protein